MPKVAMNRDPRFAQMASQTKTTEKNAMAKSDGIICGTSLTL